MATFLRHLFTLALSIGNTLLGGLVLLKLWGWFLLTVFTSAPRLDFVHAVGLDFLLSFPFLVLLVRSQRIRDYQTKGGEEETTDVIAGQLMLAVCQAILLFYSFIWHSFM